MEAVEAARKTADTVIVYLHWGTELDACPNPLQEPLAHVLVQAGADIIVGTHAHVLLGGGYLGSAYVDYGLGNFAFYDNSPPENASGSLVVTATGRHIDPATWRPAVIVDDLPQPLAGDAATAALAAWSQASAWTDVAAAPGAPVASSQTETLPAPSALVQRLSAQASWRGPRRCRDRGRTCGSERDTLIYFRAEKMAADPTPLRDASVSFCEPCPTAERSTDRSATGRGLSGWALVGRWA